jgi:hypothetical protein
MLPVVSLQPAKGGTAKPLGASPKLAAETLVRVLADKGLIRGAP